MDVLITATDLMQRLTAGVRILDVRWTVANTDGRPAYLAGHIPGAVFVDLDAELSDHTVTGQGRHPLPARDAFQASARRWGLHNGDSVVVYDDWSGQAAARAWWLLRAAGVTDVRILDGGWTAWQRCTEAIETGDELPEPGDIVVSSLSGLPTTEADTIASQGYSGVLLDARAASRYRGDDEPLDSRAGHIPGAVSAPTAENLTAEGTFLPSEKLHQRFVELGALTAPVTVYCGSGVTATHQIAALAHAGIGAALYPGSWSQWSSDSSRPIATGPAAHAASESFDHAGRSRNNRPEEEPA